MRIPADLGMRLPQRSAFGAAPSTLGSTSSDRGGALVAAASVLTLAGAIVVAFGCLSLLVTSVDGLRLPLIGALVLALAASLFTLRVRRGGWDAELIVLLAAAIATTAVLAYLPQYLYGYEINGIVHRSLITGLLCLAVGAPAMCAGGYHLLGSTPSARDASRMPLVVLPIGLMLTGYAAILVRVAARGAANLDMAAFTHSYAVHLRGTTFVRDAGMRNPIEGTMLLVLLTCIIALPIGVAVGVYVSEYGGRLGHVIGFATSMLRAVSVFILAAGAFSMVSATANYATDHPNQTWVSDLVRGYYRDDQGFKHAANGSFLFAAIVLSLLVLPVIARATEEGLRSLPREIREGSLALGATDGHALLRILLPWAAPNIITGLLLGAAEAAGSVTVIIFIAGTGEHGVGPLHEVTSLGYLIFAASQGKSKQFTDSMAQYRYSAALLLLVFTFVLTASALALRARFGKRYRGGISYGA